MSSKNSKAERLQDDSLEQRTSSGDFIGKQRYSVPFEGPHPDELTEEELNRINTRWEGFFRQKKGLIDYLADYDEDLASIGMLSVRRTIALYPDCPDNWLVQRVKYDMKNAKGWGGSIDSGGRYNQRYDIGYITGDDAGSLAHRLADFLTNKQEYRLLEQRGEVDRFEKEEIDKLAFQQYLNALDEMEQRLVQILREEYRDPPRWFKGEYVKVPERRKGAKKRFKQEVSRSETDYLVSFAHARQKFYEMFGSDAEMEQERKWYRDWEPNQSLHASRTGKYQRTGEYAKKK